MNKKKKLAEIHPLNWGGGDQYIWRDSADCEYHEGYGTAFRELTREDIQHLLDGGVIHTVGYMDEYGMFIRLKPEGEDD